MESLDFHISQEVGSANANEDIHHQTNRKLIHIQIELENDQLIL